MGVKGERGHENGKMEKYVEVNLEKLKRCIVVYICCNIIRSNAINLKQRTLAFILEGINRFLRNLSFL